MKKKYFLEQCKRLKSIHAEESINFINDNNEWWVNHNKGHELLINATIEYLEKSNQFNKNKIKKWLRMKLEESEKIINTLDIKYNLFINDEKMTREDSYTYSLQDGISCMSLTLLDIVNKRKYISKKYASKAEIPLNVNS